MKVFGKSTFKVAALAVLGLSTVVGAGLSAQAAPASNSGPNGTNNGEGAGRGRHKGGRGGLNLRGMAQKLNLTAEQQTQITTILQSSRAQSQGVRGDSSLTEAQQQERMKAIHKASRDAVMNLLTPAQQTQLQQMMAQRRAGKGVNVRKMAQELNLSDAQKEQMKSIRQRSTSAIMAVRNDTSLSPEQKRAQLKTIRTQVKDSIDAVLTPEQQAKMQEIRQERRAHRGAKNNGARAQRNQGLNG